MTQSTIKKENIHALYLTTLEYEQLGDLLAYAREIAQLVLTSYEGAGFDQLNLKLRSDLEEHALRARRFFKYNKSRCQELIDRLNDFQPIYKSYEKLTDKERV